MGDGMSHYLDIVIGYNGPELRFRCDARPTAPCRRRRPPDWQVREDWSDDEATETEFECWAKEWADANGMEAFFGVEGTVLASAPIELTYHGDDGIEIEEVTE